MKIDFTQKKSFGYSVGTWMSIIGFWIFIGTFWLQEGFFLGGDATFLGNFQPALEVMFPYCGIGIFLIFFGKFFNGTCHFLNQKQLIFLLSFLVFLAFSSVFSLNSHASILFLILWTTGLTAMSSGDMFIIKGSQKRWLLFLSLVLGVYISKQFPSVSVSNMLLGIGGLLGGIFALYEDVFRGRWILLLFYAWLIFQTGNTGLIAISFFVFLGANLWLPRARKQRGGGDVMLFILFLLGLSIWSLWKNGTSFSIVWGLPLSFFQSFQTLFFGAGEGQFLVAFQKISSEIFLPQSLVLPNSGYLLTLSEKGFGGLFFLFLLLCAPYAFFPEKKLLWSVLFGLLMVCTSVLVGTENGILFFTVFLFAFEKKKSLSRE